MILFALRAGVVIGLVYTLSPVRESNSEGALAIHMKNVATEHALRQAGVPDAAGALVKQQGVLDAAALARLAGSIAREPGR